MATISTGIGTLHEENTLNAREAITTGIAVVGLLGTAFFASQASRANERIRALEKQVQDLSPLRAKADRAEKELQVARTEGERLRLEAVQGMEDRNAVQARMADLEAVGKEVPFVPPPAARKKKDDMRKMMKMSQKMADNPAMKEMNRRFLGKYIEEEYAEFFQESGLDPDLQAKVVQALVDRKFAQGETAMMLYDQDLSEEEILRRQAKTLAEQESAMTALLGGQYGRLEDYEKTLPDRIQAKAVDRDLQALDLQPDQQDQVRAIILEEQKALEECRQRASGLTPQNIGNGKHTVESIRKAREMLDIDPVASMAINKTNLASMAESRDRTLARLQPLLSRDQYETFKKQEDAKVQMVELSLQMMQSMGE